MTEQSEAITISPESAPFYWGVAAGHEVSEAWQPYFDEHKPDEEAKARVFWFYVGLAAADRGIRADQPERVATFLNGATTRAPQSTEDELPEDWPEELTEEQQDAMDNLVHDTASNPASDINNNGPDAQLHYLLANGFTYAEVRQRIGLDA